MNIWATYRNEKVSIELDLLKSFSFYWFRDNVSHTIGLDGKKEDEFEIQIHATNNEKYIKITIREISTHFENSYTENIPVANFISYQRKHKIKKILSEN